VRQDRSRLFVRSEQALSADVGEDVVALHVARGHCYGMEKVAAAVWNLLAEPTDLDRICEQLVQRYEIDEGTCRAEVGALLAQFESEGLVEAASDRP
jgi:hypothetical protein